MSEFALGAYVCKHTGAFWEGVVVGHYGTQQTEDGVAVQLFGWEDGPVQIYPAAALQLCDRSAGRCPPPPSSHVVPQFLSTEDGEFNGNEQPEADLSALEEIKYLACTAGAPGHMPVPKALARILSLCNRAGVTKKLDELRPLFDTTEGSTE
jgi:hypothetical protein